jgi:hypothetical protein
MTRIREDRVAPKIAMAGAVSIIFSAALHRKRKLAEN